MAIISPTQSGETVKTGEVKGCICVLVLKPVLELGLKPWQVWLIVVYPAIPHQLAPLLLPGRHQVNSEAAQDLGDRKMGPLHFRLRVVRKQSVVDGKWRIPASHLPLRQVNSSQSI
jgi:hypothetical protein